MTHGGTNWGHWAGANFAPYAPDVTSYDYDAPINESGNPTEKFWKLRNLLIKYNGNDSMPPLPDLIEPISINKFSLTEYAPINIERSFYTDSIKTMEEFDQGFGSIVYRTKLPAIKDGTILKICDPHDFAQIFIDGEYIGKLDRRLGKTDLQLKDYKEGCTLDIFVEAMGRVNFGVAIKDYKGITEKVALISGNLETELTGWDIYLIPDELSFYENMPFSGVNNLKSDENGRYPRGIYKGKFNVDKPSDTFLSFEKWGKGLVYVNGYALGRIWDIGPQQTLYMPGPWLKKGENEILIFDILGPKDFISEGLKYPIINKLQGEAIKKHRKEGETLSFGNLSPVFGGSFPIGNGWKRQEFDKPVTGRYVAIEAISPVTFGDDIAIAEFYLLDDNGKRMDRESWSIYYADSEDTDAGNHTADKIFDLQESTYWLTEKNAFYPHIVVIDLGKEEDIKGIEYLPRMETGAPGAIQDYRIYISTTPFKK